MNIGHDLLRRYGPARTPMRGDGSPPRRPRTWLAIAIVVLGLPALLALGWLGARSEPVARLAVGICAMLVAGLVVDRIVSWIAAPVHEHAGFDAGDVFDWTWTPAWLRWGRGIRWRWAGSPVRAACTVLAVPAVMVSLGLARHWDWIPSTYSSRGLRGALAPARPAQPPAPAAQAPGVR